MKVLFTGATGVLGRAGVPALLERGHDVSGVVRTEREEAWLDDLGARPVTVDLFDANSIAAAMSGIDTVVHYATSIPRQSAMPKRDSWEMNDRLRDMATGMLVDAALAGDVGRFVQQSVTLVYADGGAEWIDEESAISPPWDVIDSALAAEAHVDRFRAAGGTGIVLRLSRLYGPGAASGEYIDAVRQRKLPVVGRGDNYVSSIHVSDATSALVASLQTPDGTYNITDDEPVTSADYTGTLAELLEAPTPRRIPRMLGRIALGKAAGLLTVSHRVSNSRFVTAAGWAPEFPSIREGWRDIVASGE